ncbi:MAG: T9SS type B sorting domain-containing protein, partial [Saprospiraceae bacterium]|nr:T9SS type B sorting domain-containing protein [Saprospiraceae bacterium]
TLDDVPFPSCPNTSNQTIRVEEAVSAGVANPPVEICSDDTLVIDLKAELSGADSGGTWTETSVITSSGNAFDPITETFSPGTQSPGTYTFVYLVNGAAPCGNDSAAVSIIINPTPVANAGPNMTLTCEITNVTLDGSGSSTGFYEWMGPGITETNRFLQNPPVSQTGMYVLTVTSVEGCISSDTVIVDQDETVPLALAGPDQELNCYDSTTTLQGSSSFSDVLYIWEGPGITPANKNLQTPEVNLPGTYNLTVVDTVNNCPSNVSSALVLDNSDPPIVLLQNVVSLSCVVTQVVLDATGSEGNYFEWIDPDGNVVAGAAGTIYEADKAGVYTLIVVDTLSGCSNSETVNIEIDTNYPTATTAQPDHLDCDVQAIVLDATGSTQSPSINYEWAGPEGGITEGQNTLNPTVILPGMYVVTVMDVDNGCTSKDTVFVTQDIEQPLADAGSDLQLNCIVAAVTLDGGNSSIGPNFVYQWTTSDGNIVSGINTLFPEVNTAGTYLLQVRDLDNGCTTLDETMVTENLAIPTQAIIDTKDPTCYGYQDGSITIQTVTGGTPPYVYAINGSSFTSNNVISFLSAGNYTITIQDANGCEFQTSVTLNEGNALTLELGENIHIQLGDSVDIVPTVNVPLSEIETMEWSPQDSTLSCTDCFDPNAKPFRTTTYEATVTDENGCEATDDITINVDLEGKVYIPNAFSPNGDGNNDIIMIFAGNNVRKIREFGIVDRWGDLVFKGTDFRPNDPSHGWDGSLRGKPMNPAVFAYWAFVEFIDGRVVLYKGDITLVR